MKRDFPKEVLGLVIVATLAAVAWWKAPQFDPKTMGFFTKNYVAPYPEMPRDFRLAGAAFAAIGGLIMLAGFKSVWRRQLTWRSAGRGWLALRW
ncbi:hypothetical protein SH584_05780 [Sphingomonas sp. LY29]|uniref:hypothetical protein n=1 Tax=Sphingomonas sp. LY29 TaxID=3095341 RepID=UPI002D78596D|nr:hypothetical protein [Sphingomonas sp. LY29]WRP26931.1 hypothetical protein SH584_05780 [Sphingomonas sp. LY29]